MGADHHGHTLPVSSFGMATDLDRRVEELASKQLAYFSVQQVFLLGGNSNAVEHRVSIGRWQRHGRGVLRLLGAADSFEARVTATLLATHSSAAASHRCAAALFGVPGFQGFVEITTRRENVVRLPGVVVHRSNWLPMHHIRMVGGIRTTSIARTLFDLSAVIRPERLERAMDNALARGMVTVPALALMSQEMSVQGRRKLAVVRALLAERGGNYVPPASTLEAGFVKLVKDFNLPTPDRQVNLGSGDSWLGRVDFYFRDERLVVEVDGSEFHSSLLDQRADAERDRVMGATGWRVLRCNWSDVTSDQVRVAHEIRSAVRPL